MENPSLITEKEKIIELENRIIALEKENSFNTRFIEFLCRYMDLFNIDSFKDLIN